MVVTKTTRLIKSEDLNHHGTLFAGRMAEWFVESSFVAAAALHGQPQDIVCVNVHGFSFKYPANKGQIIEINSMVVQIGTSSITTYCKSVIINTDKIIVDGYTTFVTVDQEGKPKPHYITPVVPLNDIESEIIKNCPKHK